MNKGQYYKKRFSLLSVLTSIFVYVGAIAIYFYANGWRVGTVNQFFIKTGVLTVESDPFLANVYVDGEEKGRTPKSVSLPTGIYDVSVFRSGYIEWKKSIEIKEQKSTPVYPWLIKEEIANEELLLLEDKEYVGSWTNESKDHTYFLTYQYNTTSLQYMYSLYRFDLNTTFWDLSTNPKIILTFEMAQPPEIELLLSPSGLQSILTISTADSTTHYLLDMSKISTLNTSTQLNISAFSKYTMSWSRDNKYLIFESDSDLISFDIDRQTRYLLIKKEQDKEYTWSTDEQGYFYKIELRNNGASEEEFEDSIYSYTLTQELMDGSSSNLLLDDLFFQKYYEYIDRYRDDTGAGKYAPFTNSPESTKSVGKIQEFSIHQNAKGIYIDTETSSYWYNMDTQKYYLVSPYPSEMIRIAPDNYRFIFKDTIGYWIFTFQKEDGDHTNQIGAKRIDNLGNDISDMYWLANSLYITYIKENTMYISDKDGDNEVKVLDDVDSLIYFGLTSSNENVVSISLIEDTVDSTKDISIQSYNIH
jgi:hypothetical protein